jgi:hypothetical protein
MVLETAKQRYRNQTDVEFKLWDCSTTNIMDNEELMSHHETLRLIKKDLQFVTEMRQRFRTRMMSRRGSVVF